MEVHHASGPIEAYDKVQQTVRFDPRFVITHRMSRSEAARGYETFETKQDDCMKVVLTP